VLQAGGKLHFAFETSAGVGGRERTGKHNLEGHFAACRSLSRSVHHAHTAPPDLLHNLIAINLARQPLEKAFSSADGALTVAEFRENALDQGRPVKVVQQFASDIGVLLSQSLDVNILAARLPLEKLVNHPSEQLIMNG
jgi:hypothetical protein